MESIKTGLLLLACCFALGQGQYIAGKGGVIATYKGSVSGGKPCYFPFIYKGRTYSFCISTDHDKFWCATTANYDTDKQWGNCEDVSSTRVIASNRNGGSSYCVFPFIYNGVNQTDCIQQSSNRPWCSTTNNYDRDQMRGECLIYRVKDIQTFGGTGAGQACAFPYRYNGVLQYVCINNDFYRPWCATTENYDVDRKWGICAEDSAVVVTKAGNAGGANCKFPYVYKGVQRSGCIPDDNPKLWCATTANYDTDNQWGRCVLYNPTVTTRDGNSFGRPCSFPFRFQGIDYYGCITSNGRGTPWCGTLRDYDASLAWGVCNLPSSGTPVFTVRGTAGGAKCVFPFTFQGKVYYNCIIQDEEDVWCATTSNYDTDKKWGYCYTY